MVVEKIRMLINDARLAYYFACRRLGVSAYQIHQIRLPEQKLIYLPIPKNACSSLKHALYEIEFDAEFDYPYHERLGYRDIHDYYKKSSAPFVSAEQLAAEKEYTIFTVSRDPVKRFISGYRNRVIDLGDLQKTAPALRRRGLPVKPDLNTFALNLEEYRAANTVIEHHSRPQHHFLGDSLAYIDRIFPIEKMDELKQMLRNVKPDLTMRSEKSGGTEVGLRDLSASAFEKLLDFYEDDYYLLSDYYSRQAIVREYEQVQKN